MKNAFFICDLVFTVDLIIGLQKCCVIVVTEFGRLSCRFDNDLTQKALAQELTSKEQQNVRLLDLTSGHLFEQSGNDYLGSWSIT